VALVAALDLRGWGPVPLAPSATSVPAGVRVVVIVADAARLPPVSTLETFPGRVIGVGGLAALPALTAAAEAGLVDICLSSEQSFLELLFDLESWLTRPLVVAPPALRSARSRSTAVAMLRERLEEVGLLRRLTQREQQTLAQLVVGRTAAEVALEHVVSLTTVRAQIRSILLKLGVSTQREAVVMAERSAVEPVLRRATRSLRQF
jgi:DNA-binding NarL/FixJ family response regulator